MTNKIENAEKPENGEKAEKNEIAEMSGIEERKNCDQMDNRIGNLANDGDKEAIGHDSENSSKTGSQSIGITDNPTFNTVLKISGWGIVAIGLYILLSNFPIFSSGVIDTKAGLLLIFFTGVLTSLHCIGMCSGFVVSYASNTSSKDITPHLCYNGSRIFSYTVLGAVLGFVGSIFSFNNQIRSYLAIFAGLFMVAFGLSMFFPQIRRFVSLPGLNLHGSSGKKKGPIMIGLLNGLMPCGPLQAMLIYAAGTGSIVEGALVMLAFGLGTVPLMLILGSITSIAASSRVLIHRIVKFSGVLVLVLGVIMLNRGFALSGIDVLSPLSAISAQATVVGSGALSGTDQPNGLGGSNGNGGYQEITMYIDKYGWDPNILTVKKGIPVRWTIIAKELTYCNKGIKVPALGINKVFDKNGESATFEFTPTEAGTISFTCWMGMIPGRIVVVDSTDSVNGTAGQQNAELALGSAVLNIRGMCCQGCANKIQNSVGSMDGIRSIKVDYASAQGNVEYDPSKVTIDQVIAKIDSLGYKAKVV